MIKKIQSFFRSEFWVIFIALAVSIIASYVSFSLNLQTSNFDAMSRLNIARKVVDNLTPGLGQFGSVWPFLPQLLMLPFIIFEPLWHSGIAGAIMSGTSFVLSAFFIFKILLHMTKSKIASFLGVGLFITNINLLLLQSMAMSEPLFIALILGCMYFLLYWSKNPTRSLIALSAAGACAAGASLVRYEGVAFACMAIVSVIAITLLKKYGRHVAEGLGILFGSMALFGIFLWCLYNLAIFHDPIYWARIYSGQSSIISSDTQAKKVVTDQSAKKIKIQYITKAEQYTLSVVEMTGLPIFAIGLLGLLLYIPLSKPWKKPEPYILLLPLSIVAFMLLTFLLGGVPVVVPWLNAQSILNFKTTYAYEYNIRYGILLWPLIVLMISWLLSRHRILLILGFLVLAINIALPMYHKYFLMYQLPLKWSTGSATSHSEDQALRWFRTNYDGGLILMSALKHDPVMFQMNIPYKNFIHEGAGKYWITSRSHPEKYAQWIFMADASNIRGGVDGEEDSVSKYVRYDPTLNEYYDQRYNDGIIAIYKRRPVKTNAAVAVHTPWQVRSIDTMKLTRDNVGNYLKDTPEVRLEINAYINQIKGWGANYIAIDTPYDEKFYPALKLWTDLAHEQGLHVWFRGNWSAWEGWFDFPKTMTREEHIQKTYAFIKSHSTLFQDGDSFTPCPECENGGPGDPRVTGDKAGYNAFMVNLYLATNQAFSEIGKQVYHNWYSVNGDVAKEIITPETVKVLDGVITIDHYVDAPRMQKDILWLIQNDNAKVMIGEYGTSNPTQLNAILHTISGFGSNVMGVNYWVNIGGDTGLIDDSSHALRPSAKVLTSYFQVPQFTGHVQGEKGKAIAGVLVSGKNHISTDIHGNFRLSVISGLQTYTFSKKGYVSYSLTLDFSKADPQGHTIQLQKPVRESFLQKYLPTL